MRTPFSLRRIFMKKIITALTALALVCSFTSCGDNNDDTSSNSEITQIPTGALNEAPVSGEVVQPFIDYFDGFNENDTDKVILSITPQAFVDALKAADKYAILTEQTQNDISSTMTYWSETYGDDTKASYVEEVSSRPLTEEQIYLAELCYKYTYYDVQPEFEIEEGFEVVFKYRIEGSKDHTEDEETACFVKVKDDGWKMLATSAGILNQYNGVSDPYDK